MDTKFKITELQKGCDLTQQSYSLNYGLIHFYALIIGVHFSYVISPWKPLSWFAVWKMTSTTGLHRLIQ